MIDGLLKDREVSLVRGRHRTLAARAQERRPRPRMARAEPRTAQGEGRGTSEAGGAGAAQVTSWLEHSIEHEDAAEVFFLWPMTGGKSDDRVR